ncbi:CNP1-like family protein [Neisseria sp. Ec49-e6-T10]|uniref:CNP1-like family protein n=1 Tax=Neisseria sp. Ec49-e6-T10 TaxID=3140744 RepID=UPI003EBE5654
MKSLLKLITPFIFMSFLVSAFYVQAEIRTDYSHMNWDETPWGETKLPLPPYRTMEEGKWQEFYVGENYKNKAMIDLESVDLAEDGTIRYVLNLQSQRGANNLSAEGILCNNRLNKIFAFGDTFNHQWIMNKKADWKSISVDDKARLQIRYMLCNEGAPRSAQIAIQRIIDGSSKVNYGKGGANTSKGGNS